MADNKTQTGEGYEVPSNILVAVGAVIEDDKGRILLVKHKLERAGYWQGKWICPGGRLEFGEGIEEGLKREVKEETNLDVEPVRPLLPFDRIVRLNGRSRLHVIYIDYTARFVGGELEVGSDVGEALWLDKEDISRVWRDLHEDTQRLLRLAGIVWCCPFMLHASDVEAALATALAHQTDISDGHTPVHCLAHVINS